MTIKWKAEKIIGYVGKGKKEQEYICAKVESKEWRTIAQNATLHKIIGEIRQFNWRSMEDAKKYTLIYCFSYFVHEYKWEKILVPNHVETKKLDKYEAIKYIDFLIDYCKENKIWVVITSAEVQSLYQSYN